jgi:hypothetical protein
MQEINITLWRHEEENDWSVEFAGRLHRHVSTKTVDELVEFALVAAQEAEMKRAVPPGKTASLSIH